MLDQFQISTAMHVLTLLLGIAIFIYLQIPLQIPLPGDDPGDRKIDDVSTGRQPEESPSNE
jgi:hypothetical protein